MNNNFPSNPPNYIPLFEIGIINGCNPAVRGFAELCISLSPVTLAAITTALFEAVMMNVEENQQIQYEHTFNKAFKKLMKCRHELEITRKFIEPNGPSSNPKDEFE